MHRVFLIKILLVQSTFENTLLAQSAFEKYSAGPERV